MKLLKRFYYGLQLSICFSACMFLFCLTGDQNNPTVLKIDAYMDTLRDKLNA